MHIWKSSSKVQMSMCSQIILFLFLFRIKLGKYNDLVFSCRKAISFKTRKGKTKQNHLNTPKCGLRGQYLHNNRLIVLMSSYKIENKQTNKLDIITMCTSFMKSMRHQEPRIFCRKRQLFVVSNYISR